MRWIGRVRSWADWEAKEHEMDWESDKTDRLGGEGT